MGGIRNTIAFTILVVMVAFEVVDMQLLPPNYVQIMQEFGVTEAQMGFVSSIFIATNALATAMWGFLSDVATRKKLLLIGVYSSKIPCLLTAFARNYWELLLIRSMTGLSIGSITPIAYTLIADLYEEAKRGRGYALIGASSGLGTLFGMILGGFIPDWRSPFIYAAIPNMILAPIFYVIFQEPKRGISESALREIYEKGLEYRYRISWETLKSSLKTRTNILLFTQGVIGTFPWGVVVTWLISFLIVARGMIKSTATIVLMLIGLAQILGGIIGGLLGDWAESRRRGGRAALTGLAIFAGMIAAIYFIVHPWPSKPSLLDLLLIAAYGFGLLQVVSYAGPNVRTILSQVNPPEARGTVFGVFTILDNVGWAIGPVLGGLLIEYLRSLGYSDPLAYQWALIISVLAWLPCSAIWVLIYKQYPVDRDRIAGILEERARKILGGA